MAQERAHLNGPVPVRILRAAQFHEFVAELVKWTTQGDTAYLPPMRTQLLAAQRGSGPRIEAGEFFEDPEGLYPAGAVLPGPLAKLAGPTYEEWLTQ